MALWSREVYALCIYDIKLSLVHMYLAMIPSDSQSVPCTTREQKQHGFTRIQPIWSDKVHAAIVISKNHMRLAGTPCGLCTFLFLHLAPCMELHCQLPLGLHGHHLCSQQQQPQIHLQWLRETSQLHRNGWLVTSQLIGDRIMGMCAR